MIVYAVVRVTRTHTEFKEFFTTDELARAFAAELDLTYPRGARPAVWMITAKETLPEL